VAVRDKAPVSKLAPIRVLLASSNRGKLREYRELARDSGLEVDLMPNFRELPPFEESAPTFAENSAGKALHYSPFSSELILSDDSGLVVPALGGAPGVRSARYAGPNATDADRVRKLLLDMEGKQGDERRARFVCVTAIALRCRIVAVVSDCVEGIVTIGPCGMRGFGYDPIFFTPALDRTFAEVSPREKNRYSHRGRAFRKVLAMLINPADAVTLH
jgi:XTP/dITP diphosphohydrolase